MASIKNTKPVPGSTVQSVDYPRWLLSQVCHSIIPIFRRNPRFQKNIWWTRYSL